MENDIKVLNSDEISVKDYRTHALAKCSPGHLYMGVLPSAWNNVNRDLSKNKVLL